MKISLKLKTAIALIGLCSLAGVAQAQEKAPAVKDLAEYDMIQAIQKETDGAKKIALLTTWKDKYPESDFKIPRLLQMLGTYQQLQQADKMYTTAQELVKLDPTNINGLFYVAALPPALNVNTPQRLTEAEQGAAALKAALPGWTKPAGMTDDQFATQKKSYEKQVIKTNVWVATQRKDMAKVEQIYTDLLKANPNDGESSYELGRVILGLKKPERQAEALYHIGRAAYYEGPNALDPTTRKSVQAFFERTVTTYTGSKADVQMIADQTKASAFPPPGFDIDSAATKVAKQMAAMQASDPQKYLWLQVKNALLAPDGATYFDGTMKGSGLPKLKGKLVSAMPANKPKEITIAIMDDATPEIKLVVDRPFAGAPPAGTVLEFEMAVPTTFSADPFLVTADIDQEQITGWPAEMKGAPATGKKTTTQKKAVTAKKK